ncbi:MAG: CPBP family intramembrane glutamic endopeptidase [Actinomycetota bacterium]
MSGQETSTTRLGRHPWVVAFAAFVISLVPSIVFIARTGGEYEGSVLIALWPGLVLAAVLLVLLIWATGWTRNVGFVAPRPGWWKVYLLPVLWAAGLLILGSVVNWSEPEDISLLALLAILLLIGFNEEIVYRGFFLHAFQTRMPLFTAVSVSSVVFALMHMGTPGADASTLSILITMLAVFSLAILQSALYLVGRSIVVVIMFHVWWDFMMFSGGAIDLQSDAAGIGWAALVATIVMSAGYGTYLLLGLRGQRDAADSSA